MNLSNEFFIQIQGPFKAEIPFAQQEWFVPGVISEENKDRVNLRQIAVQVHSENVPGLITQNEDGSYTPNHRFKINDEQIFAIGATGILEIQGLNIEWEKCNDMQFLQDEPASTIVDLVLYKGDEEDD